MVSVTARDPVDLSVRQFIEAWRVMFADLQDARVHRGDGIECVFSGLPIGFFNIGFVISRGDSAEALQGRARAACAWATDKNVPWLLTVTHEALASGVDAAAALEPTGFAPMLPLTGMLASQLRPGAGPPAGLLLEVPDDDAGCAALLDVNSAAYGMPLDAAKPALGRCAFWAGHVPALGLVDGTPVSSAAVLMADGHRYVALVATEPGYQRRGYGEAAMRYALDIAAKRHGDRPTFLHATEAGRPIYARMGYETVSTHTVFIEKRFLEGH
jgi:ribosomal protein S18 acetylase RimI-like enzyme